MAWSWNFGASDQSINLTAYPSLDITTGATVCAWLRTTTSHTGIVLAKWGADQAYLLYQSGTNYDFTIRVSEVSKNAVTTGGYTTADWVHVAGIFDGANVRIKTNAGRKEDITGSATSGPIDVTADQISLGKYSSSGSPWTGQMEDMCVFNRALSDNELLEVMRNGPGRLKGLVMHFPFAHDQGPTTSLGAPPLRAIRNEALLKPAYTASGAGVFGPRWNYHASPDQPAAWPRNRFDVIKLIGKPPPGPVTGTAAFVAGTAILAASGTIVNAYTGTAAFTAGAATMAATGTVVNPAANTGALLLLGVG